MSVPTLPASIVDNWAASGDGGDTGGNDGEQSTDAPVEYPGRRPSAGQASDDR